MDLPLKRIDTPEVADRARQRLEHAGLRWGLFWMPFAIDAPAPQYEAGLERLKAMAPLAAAAGAGRTYNHIWPAHDCLDYVSNFHFHVERIKPVADLLREHGITYGIEFIGPQTMREGHRHPFIHRLDQALELIDAAGGGCGLVLDTFHWYTSGGTLDELRRALPGVDIVNVHVNDAQPDRSRDAQLDHERAMPLATGVIDAAQVLGILHELKYDGPVIVEPFEPEKQRLSHLDRDAAAAEVIECMKQLMQQAGIDGWA